MYGSIFCCSVPGKKAEPLAGFDGRARQNDAVDLLGEQRADGHGHGDVGLAGAAGADGEHHVVLLDLFHVAALAGVLGCDGFLAERARAGVLEHAARRFVRLFGSHADQRFHFGAGELAAVAREVVVFLDDLHGLIDAFLLAFDGQARVVQMRAHVQRVLEQAHVLIERAEEGFNLSGNVNGTSHPSGGFACYRNGLADGEFLLVPGAATSVVALLNFVRGQLWEKLLTP